MSMMQCHALITRVYFIIYQDIHIYQYITIKVPALRLLVRLLQGFLLLCWPLLALRLLLRLLLLVLLGHALHPTRHVTIWLGAGTRTCVDLLHVWPHPERLDLAVLVPEAPPLSSSIELQPGADSRLDCLGLEGRTQDRLLLCTVSELHHHPCVAVVGHAPQEDLLHLLLGVLRSVDSTLPRGSLDVLVVDRVRVEAMGP